MPAIIHLAPGVDMGAFAALWRRCDPVDPQGEHGAPPHRQWQRQQPGHRRPHLQGEDYRHGSM
jgi:hypothetical protein